VELRKAHERVDSRTTEHRTTSTFEPRVRAKSAVAIACYTEA
jgi:hypothetical protein